MTETSSQFSEGSAAGFGALLARAREAAGLSLDDVASRTKISRGQIEALENESVRFLPEPVYVRAFIRDICRVLGADPKPVLDAYRLACPDSAEEKVPAIDPGTPVPKRGLAREVEFRASPRKKGLRVLIAFAVIVALALLAWAGFGRELVAKLGGSEIEAVKVTQQDGSAGALQLPRSPSNALPANAPAEMTAQQASSPAQPSAAASSPAAQAAAPAAVAPTEAAAAAKADPAPAAAAGLATVEVRTVEASWLRMIDADGKVLVKAELGAGVEKTYTGRLPIRVTVGNARGCALTLNGNPVDLSGYSRGSVARFVLN